MIKRSLFVLLVISQSALGQGAHPQFDRLSKLRDVLISNPQNSQVLTYDSALTQWKNADATGGGGSGTVTTFSAGNLSPLFTTSVTNASTTPALSFSLSMAGSHNFLGNNTGSVAAPAYVQPAFTDLSGSATDAQVPNILTLTGISNLTSNGFVKTSGGAGTLSIDTNTYLTGNQTITISGDASGSGSTAITLALSNIPDLTTQAGSILATNIAAPTTPAAGKTKIYVDSTSKNIAAKNDAGTVNHGIQTRSASGSTWVKSIADDGSTTATQPAFTDISGTATTGQIPALGGNPSVNVTLSAQNGTATTYLRSDGAPALSQAIAPVWTAAHTWTLTDAINNASTTIATFNHDTTGTPGNSITSRIVFGAETSTTVDRPIAFLEASWADVNDGTRSGRFTLTLANGADPATAKFFWYNDGSMSVGNNVGALGSGIAQFTTGILIGNSGASGKFPLGDGTKMGISPYTVPTSSGAANSVWISDGSNVGTRIMGRVASITSIVDQTGTAEQAHVTYTVPANSVSAGTTFRITAAGNMDNGTTAITFTPRVRWGGTAGVQLLAIPTVVGTTTAQTNKTWRYEATVTIRSVGASGVCVAESDLSNHTASATGVFAEESTNPNAGFTIDTTVNKDLVFTWALSATTGTPHVRTHSAMIEQL